jgi:5-methylcytosine-specific restriction endonuclease McrA
MVPHSNYKYGDTREDGYVFVGWKRRGEKVTPDFRNPISFKKQNEASRIRKMEKRNKITKIMNDEKVRRGCTHCGEHFYDNPECLDFHHVDPSTKIKSVGYYWRSSWKQFNRMKEEWKKCIVLCANCHRKETKRILDA